MIVLLLTLAAQTPATPAEIVKESREQNNWALAASMEQNWPRFLEAASRAAELRPQHMGLLLQRASAEALSGQREAALASLRRAADAGYAVAIPGELDFGALAGDPDFLQLAERLRANASPRVASSEAQTLADASFCAEGVAYDPIERALYLGSFTDGRILRVTGSAEARAETLFATTSAHGPAAAYGMAVDAERRLLWVCAGAALGQPGPEDRGALLAFALEDGSLQRAVRCGADSPRLLGDLALGADGSVFVSDPLGGAILRLAPESGTFSTVLSAGHLMSVQGLVLLPARAPEPPLLLVADYACGLFSLPSDGSALPQALGVPDGAALLGIDGLAWHDGALIAVQNGMTPPRVLRLTLDPAARRVLTRLDVLESAHPRYGEPTLGVVVGDALLYLANAPWPDPAQHEPALILRLPLR